MIEIALEHIRTHSDPSILRHTERRLRRFTSAKTESIIQLFGSFNEDWREDLQQHLIDELKDAVDSIVDLRHSIAHGGQAGITITRVQNYYQRVKQVVDYCADLCIPQ